MNSRKTEPSQEQLRRLFTYDDNRGVLIHKTVAPTKPYLLGKVAGNSRDDGYIDITVSGKLYKAHRLIYIHQLGEIPNGKTVDHIDRNRSNNRVENLRAATKPQQNGNRNCLGFYRHKQGKWHARLKYQRKNKHLGLFPTALQARLAYEAACLSTLGEYSPTAYFTEALTNIFDESCITIDLSTNIPYLFLSND